MPRRRARARGRGRWRGRWRGRCGRSHAHLGGRGAAPGVSGGGAAPLFRAGRRGCTVPGPAVGRSAGPAPCRAPLPLSPAMGGCVGRQRRERPAAGNPRKRAGEGSEPAGAVSRGHPRDRGYRWGW